MGGSAAWSSPATRGGSRPVLTADASDHTSSLSASAVRFFSPVWPGRLSSPSSPAVRQEWAALSSLTAVPPRPPISAGRSSLLPAPLRLRLGLQVHLYWLATSALRLTAGEMRPCGPVSGSWIHSELGSRTSNRSGPSNRDRPGRCASAGWRRSGRLDGWGLRSGQSPRSLPVCLRHMPAPPARHLPSGR